jgi:preprotein translocase subunit SecE
VVHFDRLAPQWIAMAAFILLWPFVEGLWERLFGAERPGIGVPPALLRRTESGEKSMGSKRGSATKGGGSKKAQQQKQGFASGPRKFVRDVQGELKRVTWPDRDQLRQSTAVVLIIVLVLTAYVYAWDLVFQNLARLIFSP